MADHEAPGAVEPVGSLLLAEARVEQHACHRFDELECGLGDRWPRAEQQDDVRVREECCANRVGDGTEVALQRPMRGGSSTSE